MKTLTQLQKAKTSTPGAARADSAFVYNPDLKKMTDLLFGDGPIYTAVLEAQLLLTSGFSEDSREAGIGFTTAAFASIAPRDGLERLLVAQMIGCHNLAMAFMARAASNDQPSEALDKNVSRATRLMDMFVSQIGALKSYRSRGEQKVRVEHVHVNASAQAVVGCLNAERKS